MYHYGGVYVDLDFESLRPLDALLDKRDIALAQMGERILRSCGTSTRAVLVIW